MSQGPGSPLRGPGVVAEGGVLVIDVGNDAGEVDVSEAGAPGTTTHPVGPDKKARIPVTWPGGSILFVSVGRWPNRHTILVEVISTLR